MKEIELLQKILNQNETTSKLKLNSTHQKEVKALQIILNDLGYGRELKWEKYGADGDYGICTQRAVKTFCGNNKNRCSGKSVTSKTAERIIYLHGLSDEITLLNDIMLRHNIEKRVAKGSRYSKGIAALQKLLSELGYNRRLKWNKYGADGKFGKCTESALSKYAEDEGYLDSGEALTEKLTESIINKFKSFYGYEFLRETIELDEELTETITGNNFILSDGSLSWTFRKYQKGVYTYGKVKPESFIKNNETALKQIGMSKSAINIMVSVAENEGNLDAVNTWDNAFLSFGMFQWTLGTSSNAGELAALLYKLRKKSMSVFRKHFLNYGLNIAVANDTTGYLQLDGIKLEEPAVKEHLRNHDWAYRFWRAGQDSFVQSIEVEHAFSRIKTFYKSENFKVDNYFISDLIKSEYGMALILDNHVNRPGYVTACLSKALKNTKLENPFDWETKEEKRLIKEYLEIRKTYGRTPMTDAEGRARITEKYLKKGIISDERGSFTL